MCRTFTIPLDHVSPELSLIVKRMGRVLLISAPIVAGIAPGSSKYTPPARLDLQRLERDDILGPLTDHDNQPAPGPPPPAYGRRWTAGHGGLLAALVLAHLVLNTIWISSDLSLRSYDAGPHLEAQVQAVRVLQQQGLAGLARLVRPQQPGWWPSAGYLPTALLALVFGEGFARMRLYHLIYLVLLLVAVAQIGRWLHSRRAGLLAAALVGLLPVVFGEGRNPGVDLPGTAMLCVAVWLLLASGGFSRPGRCAWLGLVVGCGVLIRPQMALFFAPLALAALVLVRRRPELCTGKLRPASGALLAGAVALVTASPWWLGHAEQILRTFARHQLDATMLSENAQATPLFYLQMLPWAFSPWLLVGLLLALWGWFGKGSDTRRRHPLRPLVWIWLASAVLLVLVIKVHFVRFLLPLCPALALVTAMGIQDLRRSDLRRVAVTLLLAVATGQWIVDSLLLETTPDRLLSAAWAPARPRGQSTGPPRQEPEILALEGLAREIQRRHRRYHGLVLKMVESFPSGRLRWCAGPLLRLALPGARVQGQSYKGRYIFEHQAYLKIGGTVMPLLDDDTPRSHHYVVTLEHQPPARSAYLYGARRSLEAQIAVAGAPRWVALWSGPPIHQPEGP